MNPNEVFDGLPVGAEGLSACIELCVLATDFRCKVGFFNFYVMLFFRVQILMD